MSLFGRIFDDLNPPVIDENVRRILDALASSPEASSAEPDRAHVEPSSAEPDEEVPDDETEPDEDLVKEWTDELWMQWTSSGRPPFEIDGEIDPEDFYRQLYRENVWLDEDWRQSVNDNLLLDYELTTTQVKFVTLAIRKRFRLTRAQIRRL
jgi:hypothetical protein